MIRLLRRSTNKILPASVPIASVLPWGDHARAMPAPAGMGTTALFGCSPGTIFQRRTGPSAPTEANSLPSGNHSTENTGQPWPISLYFRVPPPPFFCHQDPVCGRVPVEAQALNWLATAQDCFADDYGCLRQGLLTSIFSLVVGLERVFHLDEMDNAGLARL
jgi:hypothetical protein